MNMMMKMLALVFVIGLSSCSKDKWEGFVYPNRDDLTVHENIGVYESLESCRAAAHAKLSTIGASETGDYECGLNCKYRDGLTVKVCEKTER